VSGFRVAQPGQRFMDVNIAVIDRIGAMICKKNRMLTSEHGAPVLFVLRWFCGGVSLRWCGVVVPASFVVSALRCSAPVLRQGRR
jgi:hypothetical protein